MDANGSAVFYAFRNLETGRYDLAKVNADTLKSEIFFSSAGHDARLRVSQDDTKLAFNREDDGDISIAILDIEN